MDAQMQARRAMETDLRKALPAGEFELHYQPVVEPRDRRDQRLRGPDPLAPSREGHDPAGRLHPLAEEIGLIVPIGEWVSGRPARAPRSGRPI